MAGLKNTLAVILAGGRGDRLQPLTRHRAKPAVPFGGKYRIIDFALSNCINSQLRKVAVLIQYKSQSLDRHVRMGWNILNPEMNEYIISVPPQQRISHEWYRGTADAVRQNLFLIDSEKPDILLVLAGDHVYTMDYTAMYEFMVARRTEVVVGAIPVPLSEASRFGILEVDEEYRILRFDEKPKNPRPMPRDRTQALSSMGIYLFDMEVLRWYLQENKQKKTGHDFGRDLIPQMVTERPVHAYPFFQEKKGRSRPYWRDIGTLDAYWEANMDLVAVSPPFNLYDETWPVRTYQGQYPPAKFVFADLQRKDGRVGYALDSIVCDGCIISGGRIQNCVLSPAVRIDDHADVRESVIMENVMIGKHARVKRAIIDKDVVIPPGARIGYDREADAARFTVTDSGIVVISKGMVLE